MYNFQLGNKQHVEPRIVDITDQQETQETNLTNGKRTKMDNDWTKEGFNSQMDGLPTDEDNDVLPPPFINGTPRKKKNLLQTTLPYRKHNDQGNQPSPSDSKPKPQRLNNKRSQPIAANIARGALIFTRQTKDNVSNQ